MAAFYETSGGDSWRYWTSSATTSCSNINTQVWTGWNGGCLTNTGIATATSSTNIWYRWNTTGVSTGNQIYYPDYETCAQVSEKERRKEAAERRKRVREMKARERKQKMEKAAADRKAKELLLDLIGEKELKVFESTGRLFVRGRKYDYIVPKKGFVQRIEKDKITDLCIHLTDSHIMPDLDNVIALKLLAEADDYRLNEIANAHTPRPRPQEIPRAACM